MPSKGQIDHNLKSEYTCTYCGKTFYQYNSQTNVSNKYCSKNCYYNYKKLHRLVDAVCKVCGTVRKVKASKYEKGSYKYCSWDCYLSEHRSSNHKIRGGSWRKCKGLILERDSFVCVWCKCNRAIDVHHIIPYRDFTTRKEANTPDNLISLCRTCHKKVTGHEYDYVELFRSLLKELYNNG